MRGTTAAIFLYWMTTSKLTTPAADVEHGVLPGLHSGLLFQPKGPLTLATGSWTAVTRFKQQEVRQQVETIRKQFLRIDQALETVSEINVTQTAEIIRNKKFITEMRRMWEQEKAWMEAELRTGEEEIHELRAELLLSRKARGLINALGDGLKWLFGTATEADTRRLHKDIEGLKVGMGKLHHIAALQTTIIGTISKGQKSNARNLASLAKRAMELEASLISARTADHITMRNIRREIDFSDSMSSAIRTAGAAVMTFHHEVKRLSRAMTHTQQGLVTTTILPPAALRATLAAITSHLPEGWIPAVPTSATPARMYKFLDISALPIEDGWEVHIQVPLHYRPYSQFHLYQVTSVPTPLPNSSLAFETEIPSAYFAIARDQRLHIEANQEDIKQRRRAEGHTMCLGLTPLIKEKKEGCLYHAYRDNRERAAHECKRTLTRPKSQIYQVSNDKWLYVLPDKERFSMQCVGETQHTKEFYLQGTGVFSLPSGCAAMGDRYVVPAHLRRQTMQPEEMRLQDMTHFKIQINKPAFELKDPENSHLNQTVLEQIVNAAAAQKEKMKNPTLADLQEKVQKWQQPTISEDGGQIDVLNHTSLSLGAVGTLGVIGLIVFCCCRNICSARHPASIPTCPRGPVSSAPTNPDSSEVQTRLAHLEAVTRELQVKMEMVARQEITLENLKKKCEQITALL